MKGALISNGWRNGALACVFLAVFAGACPGHDNRDPLPDQKVQCWDIIPDGECDLATEDINGDQKCNVRDCMGPPINHHKTLVDRSAAVQFRDEMSHGVYV